LHRVDQERQGKARLTGARTPNVCGKDKARPAKHGFGAATDVVRLIAALLDPNGTAALSRSAVVAMLARAAALNQTQSRAGYGFDVAANLGGGSFRAGKGGSWDSTSSVLYFNGQWGYTMLWGSGRPGSVQVHDWDSGFPEIMNLVTNPAKIQWGTQGFFPQFGMPSL